jgi:cytolysin (calcineurin-like family phosphatase)
MLDASGVVLSSATMAPNGNTLGAVGDTQTETLTAAQITEITSNVEVSVSGSVSVNTNIGQGGVNANAPNTTALNGIGSSNWRAPGPLAAQAPAQRNPTTREAPRI